MSVRLPAWQVTAIYVRVKKLIVVPKLGGDGGFVVPSPMTTANWLWLMMTRKPVLAAVNALNRTPSNPVRFALGLIQASNVKLSNAFGALHGMLT